MANLSTLISGGSPIGTLPVELLTNILKLTLDNGTHIATQADQRNVHAQQAVCRHWRNLHGEQRRFVVDGAGPLGRLVSRLEQDRAAATEVQALFVILAEEPPVDELSRVLDQLVKLIGWSGEVHQLQLDLPKLAKSNNTGQGWLMDDSLVDAVGNAVNLETLRITWCGTVESDSLQRLLRKLSRLEILRLEWIVLISAQRAMPETAAWGPATLRELCLTLLGGTPGMAVADLVAASRATLTSLAIADDTGTLETEAWSQALHPGFPQLRYLALLNPRHPSRSPPILTLLPRLPCLTSATFTAADIAGIAEVADTTSNSIPSHVASVWLAFRADNGVTPADVRALVSRLGAARRVTVLPAGGSEVWTAWAAAEKDELAAGLMQKGVVLSFMARDSPIV